MHGADTEGVRGAEGAQRDESLVVSPATAGFVGAVGGLLWLTALTFEYAFDLFPPSSGAAFVSDQLVFALAICCYILLLLGWRASGATGPGRGGRRFLTVWTAGWSLVLLGLLSGLVWPDAPVVEAMPAVGGLLGAVCGLATGVVVARAAVVHGWPRWAPLAVSCYVVLVLFAPAFAGTDPTIVTEGLWALGYVALGVALRAATSGEGVAAEPRRRRTG